MRKLQSPIGLEPAIGTPNVCGCGPAGCPVGLWKCSIWDPLGHLLPVWVAQNNVLALTNCLSVQLCRRNGEYLLKVHILWEVALGGFVLFMQSSALMQNTQQAVKEYIIQYKCFVLYVCVWVDFLAIHFLWLSFCWECCRSTEEDGTNRWISMKGWEPEDNVWIRV